MNGALLDEIGRRGAHRLIDPEICIEHRIGQSRVVCVLLVLAGNADYRNEVWWGTQAIADELAIPRIAVREAIAVLLECKVMFPAGKRGRANRYRFDVDAWQPITHRSGRYGSSAEVAGQVAGQVAGDPAANRRERGSTPAPPTGTLSEERDPPKVEAKQKRQDKKPQDQQVVALSSATQGTDRVTRSEPDDPTALRMGKGCYPLHPTHLFAYRNVSRWVILRSPGLHTWAALHSAYDLGAGDPMLGLKLLKAQHAVYDMPSDHGDASRPGALVLALDPPAPQPSTSTHNGAHP